MLDRFNKRTAIRLISWIMIGTLTVTLISGLACKRITQKLDEYMQEAEEHWGFSGAVLVAVNGHVLLAKGYGRANIPIGEPNTPDTKFFIGSITKQFTAAAILKLVEQGKINLDSPITRYLPDWPIMIGNKISVRHLLTHQSGIPCYTDNPLLMLHRMEGISQAELVDIIRESPLEFEPGTRFKYSNSGYIVLGEIIEAVSGQSYEAFLHHEILKPAGMLDSGYGRRDAAHPQRADGYTLAESGGLVAACPVDYSILHTAGALYSTINDMLKWDKALREGTIISYESIRQMYTPELSNYGFGWVIDERWGQIVAHHGGFLDGFNSTFERYPAAGLCVAVFSNEDYAPVKTMAYDLAAILGGHKYHQPEERVPVPIHSERLLQYCGSYQVGPNQNRYVQADESGLVTFRTGRSKQRLLYLGDDRFYFSTSPIRTIRFVRDLNDKVVSYVLDEGITQEPGVRIATSTDIPSDSSDRPGNDSIIDCETLTGSYHASGLSHLPETMIHIDISCADDGNLQLVIGQHTVLLQPDGDGSYLHPMGDLSLTFEPATESKPISCTLKLGNGVIRAEKN